MITRVQKYFMLNRLSLLKRSATKQFAYPLILDDADQLGTNSVPLKPFSGKLDSGLFASDVTSASFSIGVSIFKVRSAPGNIPRAARL